MIHRVDRNNNRKTEVMSEGKRPGWGRGTRVRQHVVNESREPHKPETTMLRIAGTSAAGRRERPSVA